jgi:hypothetical protein
MFARIFVCQRLSQEVQVRKLIVITMTLLLSGLSPVLARGMHGPGVQSGLSAPANPTVPPSLTPDPRLAGSAPLPPHQQPTRADTAAISDDMLKPSPEDAALDRKIGNICRGC